MSVPAEMVVRPIAVTVAVPPSVPPVMLNAPVLAGMAKLRVPPVSSVAPAVVKVPALKLVVPPLKRSVVPVSPLNVPVWVPPPLN